MKVIYIAGPYADKTNTNGTGNIKGSEVNIAQARRIAIHLWESGYAVICPHLNTAYFESDCRLTHEGYLKGDFAIIAKCDAVVMTPDWEDSRGATMEYEHALSLGIPVYIYPEIPNA